MLQTLVHRAGQFLNDLGRAWQRQRTTLGLNGTSPPAGARKYQPLRRILLTDEVGRTLFEEYDSHRKSARGDDETGWILLGLRELDEAVALATLPAGTHCSAGVAHVQFNSSAQALGSRIVRQLDRRLVMLGVVHTHPGSLRHPSDGDYQGDCRWVGQLRGGEGIFGIGTVNHHGNGADFIAHQPKPHVQTMGDLTFCWYALGQGEVDYRPLPCALTLGPDLARPLHPLWTLIEANAEPLDRLYRQQAKVGFAVVQGKNGSALSVTIPLAEPFESLIILLEEEEVQYVLVREGDILPVNPKEERIDQAVYLLLAELAAQG